MGMVEDCLLALAQEGDLPYGALAQQARPTHKQYCDQSLHPQAMHQPNRDQLCKPRHQCLSTLGSLLPMPL